jgi:predicted Zn-dependent peptidase
MESESTSYHQPGSTRRTGLSSSRYDNQPYGKILPIVKENMFESHPYRWSTIGSGTFRYPTLEDFKDFHKNSTSPTMLF